MFSNQLVSIQFYLEIIEASNQYLLINLMFI